MTIDTDNHKNDITIFFGGTGKIEFSLHISKKYALEFIEALDSLYDAKDSGEDTWYVLDIQGEGWQTSVKIEQSLSNNIRDAIESRLLSTVSLPPLVASSVPSQEIESIPSKESFWHKIVNYVLWR